MKGREDQVVGPKLFLFTHLQFFEFSTNRRKIRKGQSPGKEGSRIVIDFPLHGLFFPLLFSVEDEDTSRAPQPHRTTMSEREAVSASERQTESRKLEVDGCGCGVG
jgi:hypothetical protein